MSERHLSSKQQQQQRSCSDLSAVNYPGDLLSDAPRSRPRRAVPPPLVKRNTVADFANTKAYQASTASLISASEQGAQTSYDTFPAPRQCRTSPISYLALIGCMEMINQ